MELVLANAYVDLGTWWCVTPFIGAGVGGARVTMANYTDVGQTALGGFELGVRGQRIGMEFRLGCSCWSCVQGQPKSHA